MKLTPFRLQLLEALKGSSYFDTETKATADDSNGDICIRGRVRLKVNYQTYVYKNPSPHHHRPSSCSLTHILQKKRSESRDILFEVLMNNANHHVYVLVILTLIR